MIAEMEVGLTISKPARLVVPRTCWLLALLFTLTNEASAMRCPRVTGEWHLALALGKAGSGPITVATRPSCSSGACHGLRTACVCPVGKARKRERGDGDDEMAFGVAQWQGQRRRRQEREEPIMNQAQRNELTACAHNAARTALGEQASQEEASSRVAAACWQWMKEHEVGFTKEHVAFVRTLAERVLSQEPC